jgi:hypothetical protein
MNPVLNETYVVKQTRIIVAEMLFPDIEIPYYSKVSKVSKRQFYFNFRFIIMRILRLLKRLPWFSIIIVVILLLIYKYANGQNKMDELQQALVESYRGN